MTESRAHVALLVDFANLRQFVGASDPSDNGAAQADGAGEADAVGSTAAGDAASGAPTGREIAQSLVRFAGGAGRVGVARAYADWSRDPELSRELNGTRLSPVLVPATNDGEDRSHIQLAVDAISTLFNGDEPDAFVLVSGDPSLVPLVQAIRSDGSEVIVVASEGAEEISAEADQFVTFEDVLGGISASPVIPRGYRGERTPAGRSGAPRPSGRKRFDERDRDDRPPLLTEPVFDDYDWSRFVRLIDELEQRLPFVGVRYLVNKVLGAHNCGIEDPRIKRDLINQAVDEGLIEMYTVGNVNDRTDPVTACRLDRESGIVIDVLGPGSVPGGAEEDEEIEPAPSEYEEVPATARAE